MNGLVERFIRGTVVVLATFVTFLCLSSYGVVASLILVPAWHYFLSALNDWASRQEQRVSVLTLRERHAEALRLLCVIIIEPNFVMTRPHWKGRNGCDMNPLVFEPCVVCLTSPKKMKFSGGGGVHIGEYNIHRECVPHFLAPFLYERFVVLRQLVGVPGDVLSVIVAFLYRCCETPYATRHDARPSIQMPADVHRSAQERKHAWQSYPRRERRTGDKSPHDTV
jgi:hypothetical protein